MEREYTASGRKAGSAPSADVLEGHPLAEDVRRVARERGLDISSYRALPAILDQVGDARLDSRTILVMADMAERLLRFDQALSHMGGRLSSGEEEDGAATTDVVL